MAPRQSKPKLKSRGSLISNPLVGADIEVFLQDKESGAIVSAEGIIKGTKDDPFRFLPEEPHFATSLDNVMAEFCIPPAKKAIQFKENILFALGWIEGFIPNNLMPLAVPSARIDNRFLQTENAQLFGCDPDFNAWLQGVLNPKPLAESNLRSCGGHIHIGYEKPKMEVSMSLIKALDIYLGLPSIIQEPENDRKYLYGKAGAFRFKPYGVEYRTISNYYVSKPYLMEWVFNNTQLAIEFVNNKHQISPEEGEGIIAAINTNDKKLADTLCTYFGVKLAA